VCSGAMAREQRTLPEFIVLDVPDIIGQKESTRRKRKTRRTHQGLFRDRRWDRDVSSVAERTASSGDSARTKLEHEGANDDPWWLPYQDAKAGEQLRSTVEHGSGRVACDDGC